MTKSAFAADFTHVREWVFDLDNTLYPHHSNLFAQIDVKMTAYVSELLQLPRDEARKVQKDFYQRYGTTLQGLMANHDVDPDDFLEKVHDIDYSWIDPDPRLGDAIKALRMENTQLRLQMDSLKARARAGASSGRTPLPPETRASRIREELNRRAA